ncbi:MAG: hypothetical protein ABL892_04425 [Thiobacillaceae bacterium]
MMQLAQLSPEEQDFLCMPAASDEVFSSALAMRLAAVLGARMNQRVQVEIADGSVDTDVGQPNRPYLHWDNILETMWLCGRLGGNRSHDRYQSSAMSARLKRTLALALAEVWLSHSHICLPAAVSLRVQTADQHAGLDVHFPATRPAMNHWARQTIHHVE